MKVYDNYEISPCKRYEEPDSPGKFYFEPCEPHEADVWTLYGHIDGEGVEAIGDFSTREHAEEVFYRITGMQFTGAREVQDRLRVMHAGPKLVEALQAVLDELTDSGIALSKGSGAKARLAIAEATGGSPPDPRQPIIIEVRGGVVQDVLNVPPGYQYEVRDYDDRDADAESNGRAA